MKRKINFLIDDILYKKFKKYCIDNDDTMTNILIQFIKEKIKNIEIN